MALLAALVTPNMITVPPSETVAIRTGTFPFATLVPLAVPQWMETAL